MSFSFGGWPLPNPEWTIGLGATHLVFTNSACASCRPAELGAGGVCRPRGSKLPVLHAPNCHGGQNGEVRPVGRFLWEERNRHCGCRGGDGCPRVSANTLKSLVGVTGFEPPAPVSRTRSRDIWHGWVVLGWVWRELARLGRAAGQTRSRSISSSRNAWRDRDQNRECLLSQPNPRHQSLIRATTPRGMTTFSQA